MDGQAGDSAGTPIARSILAKWGFHDVECEPITVGLINATFKVVGQDACYILQRLNPIFDPALHHDIEAITAHLAAAGLTTPRLVKTTDGELWAQDESVWRVLSYIEGVTLQRAASANDCFQAGAFLARFHVALSDLDYQFQARRLGVHDTPKHLRTLDEALLEHSVHVAYDRVAPVAQAIIELAENLVLDPRLPQRTVHGDPKLSNFLFDPAGAVICLVDLDTLAKMPIPVELGDAFRSWCATSGEDSSGEFDHAFFEAGLRGYASRIEGKLTSDEWAAIPPTVERITVELASRFCADALNESYFGWDRANFPTASAHNLARAESMLALARSIHRQRELMDETVAKIVI